MFVFVEGSWEGSGEQGGWFIDEVKFIIFVDFFVIVILFYKGYQLWLVWNIIGQGIRGFLEFSGQERIIFIVFFLMLVKLIFFVLKMVLWYQEYSFQFDYLFFIRIFTYRGYCLCQTLFGDVLGNRGGQVLF